MNDLLVQGLSLRRPWTQEHSEAAVSHLLQQLVIFVDPIKGRLTTSESHQDWGSRQRVSFF